MDIADVRTAMARALESGIRDVQVNPYALSQPTPPGLQVLPPGVEYDLTMQRGLDEWTFIVQGFVAFTMDIGSQVLLDTLCKPNGSDSVKGALEADKTLGGKVQTLRVIDQSPGREVQRPDGSSLLLVEWRVQVFGN